jgi:hypothetical protein
VRLKLKQFKGENTMSTNCFSENFEMFITELCFNVKANLWLMEERVKYKIIKNEINGSQNASH